MGKLSFGIMSAQGGSDWLTKTRIEKHGEVWIVYCNGKIWGWTKDRELAERAAKGLAKVKLNTRRKKRKPVGG